MKNKRISIIVAAIVIALLLFLGYCNAVKAQEECEGVNCPEEMAGGVSCDSVFVVFGIGGGTWYYERKRK